MSGQLRGWRRVVVGVGDTLCVIAIIAAIHSEVTGGVRFGSGAIALSNRDSLRILMQAIAVGVIRHLVVPSPSLIERIRSAITRLRAAFGIKNPSRPVVESAIEAYATRAPWRFVVLVAIVSRLSVLSVGLIATRAATPQGHPERDFELARAQEAPVANLSWRWDAAWYADIAVHGYRWNPNDPSQQSVAFFPGYPLLARGALWIRDGGASVAGRQAIEGTDRLRLALNLGAAISNLAFVVALAVFLRLALLDVSAAVASRAVVLLAAYPFALYYSAPYTEALYLLATLAAVYAQRVERFGWLAICGFLAGLTKQTGFLLAIPLGFVVWAQWRSADVRLRWPAVAGALAPLAGAGGYMAYLWWRFGDPIAWVTAQHAWDRSARWIHMSHAQSLTSLVVEYPIETASTLAVLFALPWIWKSGRIHLSYRVLGFVALAVPVSMNIVPLGRVTAPVFPIFLGLAMALRSRRSFLLVAGLFFALQLVAAAQFYAWRPLY